MYILKNAFKCIWRSKGRNLLIGIIALVIAVSACIGLSIQQAAQNAKDETFESMSVTATISFDRQSMMSGMKPPTDGESFSGGGFDRDQFAQSMQKRESMTLEEYQTYAKAASVEDFYYTLTASFNGGDDLQPVSSDTDEDTAETESSSSDMGGFGGMGGMGMPGMPGGGFNFRNMSSGDFSVVGYSADTAMTDFQNGTSSVTDGAVFEEGIEEADCIISEELATYNELAVGDTLTLVNVNSEDETYTLKIVGIYQNTQSNEFSMGMFGANEDPANRIYMSAAALDVILDASAAASTTVTDSNTGRMHETALQSDLSATYVFADADAYYRFEEEARALGLDESYTVSSSDVTAFENSLTPLNTLSTMAGWFLVVILIIGAVILVVLNMFNIRERKYEIGVLTAMGMKKGKVAAQFLLEMLVVTMVAVVIGAGIGAVSAVPVTNALLANQVASQQSQQTQMEENFGRPGNMPGMPGGMSGDSMPDMGGNIPNFGGFEGMQELFGGAAEYVTEIDSAMNLTVVFQLLGIGLLLTLLSGAVSVLFVMRYDPLKILANRD